MESPCSNTDFSKVFHNLENAAVELWAFVDRCTTSSDEREALDYDVSKYLKDMRNLLRGTRSFVKAMNIRAKQFDGHISRTALNYGLNLIPDEVLSEIFSFAAERLEEKVGLSLVCKRFRSVMMSMRKMWDGHYLEMGQTPEQMVAITEGNRFDSLKAVICARHAAIDISDYYTWAIRQGLDPEEWLDPDDFFDRFYKRSLDFILPLRLEALQILSINEDEEVIRRILDSVSMQSVRTLMMHNCRNTVLHSFERQHTPSLENLDVDFVPGSAVGRDLIRCKLSDIKNHELDSLREFLASANALQYLLLFIRNGRFYEACDIPSLRSLEVNFTPHPSFARHLTRFTLLWTNRTTLLGLLAFLSSTEALQALSICSNAGLDDRGISDASSVDSMRVVALPYLASCEIHQGEFRVRNPLLVGVLAGKLSMPVLRRLDLRFSGYRLFSLEEGKRFDDDPPATITHGRFIIFKALDKLTSKLIKRIAGYLTDIGSGETLVEFYNCSGWRNEIFGLAEVVSG